MLRRAVFPGSFDPFSVAHVAIVDAAHRDLGVDQVVCSLTVDPLGKDAAGQTPVAERVDAIARFHGARPWLEVAVTHARLLADIAEGFEWLILGDDKWSQLHDPQFYEGSDAMAAALIRLPSIAYVPRTGTASEAPDDVTVVHIDPAMRAVSASAIRAGRDEWRAV